MDDEHNKTPGSWVRGRACCRLLDGYPSAETDSGVHVEGDTDGGLRSIGSLGPDDEVASIGEALSVSRPACTSPTNACDLGTLRDYPVDGAGRGTTGAGSFQYDIEIPSLGEYWGKFYGIDEPTTLSDILMRTIYVCDPTLVLSNWPDEPRGDIEDAEICIFLECDTSLSRLSCPSGSYAETAPNGASGCCTTELDEPNRNADENLLLKNLRIGSTRYNCSSADDSATVYLRVTDEPGTMFNYSYHF